MADESEKRFAIRVGSTTIPILSLMVVGRDPDCDIVFDSAAISRAHARLRPKNSELSIEDLSSANGVLVNGERVVRRRRLANGDRIVIGDVSFEVVELVETLPRLEGDTLERLRSIDTVLDAGDWRKAATPPGTKTEKHDALSLMLVPAEQMLQRGEPTEVERALSVRLKELLAETERARKLDRELGVKVAGLVVRLAVALKNPTWIEYVFELFNAGSELLPIELVDELYAAIRVVPRVAIQPLRRYVQTMRSRAKELGPSAKFVMSRLEGLEKMAATR